MVPFIVLSCTLEWLVLRLLSTLLPVVFQSKCEKRNEKHYVLKLKISNLPLIGENYDIAHAFHLKFRSIIKIRKGSDVFFGKMNAYFRTSYSTHLLMSQISIASGDSGDENDFHYLGQ